MKRHLVSKNTGEWVVVAMTVLAVLREGLGKRLFSENFWVDRAKNGDELSEPEEVVDFLRDELAGKVEFRTPPPSRLPRDPMDLQLLARRNEQRTDRRIVQIKVPSAAEIAAAGIGTAIAVWVVRKALGK